MNMDRRVAADPSRFMLRYGADDLVGSHHLDAIRHALRAGLTVEFAFVRDDADLLFRLVPFQGVLKVVDRKGHLGTFADVQAGLNYGWLYAAIWL